MWADAVPTGMLLINMAILREMYKDAPEYQIPYASVTARRVFRNPEEIWLNEETGEFGSVSGTTDMQWCTDVMKGGYFEKAGYPELQKKEFPFLVDTNIACMHIDQDGTQYPLGGVRQWCAENGNL